MGKRNPKNYWTRKKLLALGIPAVLVPGILIAITLGWNPWKLTKSTDYRDNPTLFPKTGVVRLVRDGDTLALQNGVLVRLIGIDAPNRGERHYDEAGRYLRSLTSGKQVYLEYDRYQDDKYGRILAWVWAGCEREPAFLPADYMHESGNASKPGLLKNPAGCGKGKLVNEEMVKAGLADRVSYADRGDLKYEQRIGGKK